MNKLSELKRKFRTVWPHLDERTRRIMAATEAVSLGYGGVSVVRRACGLSRKAISKGIREIQGRGKPLVGRIRRPGAGRKSITQSDPRLVQTLEGLIDEQTRGDPESALRWICKSTRAIAEELGRQQHTVSHMKVAQILHDLHYSLQSNRKTEEGADHPDRDAQFRHINVTIFPVQRFPAPITMAFTILDATPVLSTWEPTMTPVPLRWLRFGAGGVLRADVFIRMRKRS